jgi:hypothetical protein
MYKTGGISLEMRIQRQLGSDDVYPDASDSDPVTDLYEHARKLLGR